MSRLLWIAWREYVENVKTKAFLLAVLMTPVLMGLSFLIPKLLEGQRPEARRIAVADVQGELGPELVARLARKRLPGAPTEPLYVVEAADLEKLRRRALLREFESYLSGSGKLTRFRSEAVRAGFDDAWDRREFELIVKLGKRLPPDVLVDDPTLRYFVDNAEILVGG